MRYFDHFIGLGVGNSKVSGGILVIYRFWEVFQSSFRFKGYFGNF